MSAAERLTLAQAARYCGYDKPDGLRKALARGKVRERYPGSVASFVAADLHAFLCGLPPFKANAGGSVYFVESVGADAIKVGWSLHVASRVEALQIASPFDLRILGSMPGEREHERAIHEALAPGRLRGEWFRASYAREWITEMLTAARVL